MTSTTFFSGSAPSTSAAPKRSPAASPQVNKARTGAPMAAPAPRALVSAIAAYPWMTQALFAGMSPRARRLLRADY